MKKRSYMPKKLLLAAVVLGAAGVMTACDNYDETPPLSEDYLTTYIMPDGTFLENEEWEQIATEEAEYNAFLEGSN